MNLVAAAAAATLSSELWRICTEQLVWQPHQFGEKEALKSVLVVP